MNTPKQINNTNGSTAIGGGGVNPASDHIHADSPQVRQALEIMLISNKKLYQYIKPLAGIQSRHCYKLLLMANCYPMKPMSFYVSGLNSSIFNVDKNLNYLIQLGYIKTELKPRLIIPLNRYTKDRVFVVTTYGKTVINKLLGGL